MKTTPLTQEQPQYPTSPLPEAHALQKATPAVLDRSQAAFSQVIRERNPSSNGWPSRRSDVNSKPRRVPEDDISEGSKEYAKFAALHSSSGEVARLQLEPQLPASLTTQAERDQQIRRYRAEVANVRAELDLKKSELEAQTSLVKQRDAELVNMQSKLRDTESKLDDSLLSHDQQIRRYRAEVANVRAELEVKQSELEAVREAKAPTLHTGTVASIIDLNEDRSMYGLKEDDLESLQCNE